MKTQLKDRVLWFDGTSEVDADLVPELFLLGAQPEKIIVANQTADIELFNSLNDTLIKATQDKNCPLDLTWNIPAEYLNKNLDEVVSAKLKSWALANLRDINLLIKYEVRVALELQEIHLRGLDNLFKTLLYVIDTLKETKTVWGVGRGSSCASLVLFVLGLHKVDPIRFEISHTEFFHE